MKSGPTFEIEDEIIGGAGLSPVGSVCPKPTYPKGDFGDKVAPPFLIAGVDEAGRGPLCGPVVAAAVIFTRNEKRKTKNDNYSSFVSRLSSLDIVIDDSKKMTARSRDAAYEFLTHSPDVLWAVGLCSPTEIDELNILWASMRAMERAVAALPRQPDFVLVDGNRLPDNVFPSCGGVDASKASGRGGLSNFEDKKDHPSGFAPTPPKEGNYPGRAIVHGDAKSMSIAAASIIAKVTRDKIMCDLAREFPQYGWDKNAGYPTRHHLQAMKEYGINDHYRKTFEPVERIIKNSHD